MDGWMNALKFTLERLKRICRYPETLKKQLRAQQIALDNHLPTIYLVDGTSGAGRLM